MRAHPTNEVHIMKPALIITTTAVLALGIFSVHASASQEILANTMDPSDYTLQHAALDMEKIHSRLITSTQTLQEVASSFDVLLDRLEEKKVAHITAMQPTTGE